MVISLLKYEMITWNIWRVRLRILRASHLDLVAQSSRKPCRHKFQLEKDRMFAWSIARIIVLLQDYSGSWGYIGNHFHNDFGRWQWGLLFHAIIQSKVVKPLSKSLGSSSLLPIHSRQVWCNLFMDSSKITNLWSFYTCGMDDLNGLL